jgi:hypothetical protein
MVFSRHLIVGVIREESLADLHVERARGRLE